MIFSLDSMIEFWTLRNLMFLLFLPHDGLHKVFNSWNYKHRCPFMYYKNVKMSWQGNWLELIKGLVGWMDRLLQLENEWNALSLYFNNLVPGGSQELGWRTGADTVANLLP